MTETEATQWGMKRYSFYGKSSSVIKVYTPVDMFPLITGSSSKVLSTRSVSNISACLLMQLGVYSDFIVELRPKFLCPIRILTVAFFFGRWTGYEQHVANAVFASTMPPIIPLGNTKEKQVSTLSLISQSRREVLKVMRKNFHLIISGKTSPAEEDYVIKLKAPELWEYSINKACVSFIFNRWLKSQSPLNARLKIHCDPMRV